MRNKKIVLLIFIILIYVNLLGIGEKNDLKSPNSFHPSCLKVSIGGHYQLHLKGSTTDNPDIPNQYENIQESPAIGTFFSNAGNFKFAIEYRGKTNTEKTLSIGFEYEGSKLQNKESGTELFFGDKIKIKSFVPYVCFGKYVNNLLVFGKIGIPFKTYQGEANIEEYIIKNNFDNSICLRLGAGFDTNLSTSLVLSIGSDFDFGMVNRKNVVVYSEGQQVAELIAEGDDLEDTQISVYASISYQFSFKQPRGVRK